MSENPLDPAAPSDQPPQQPYTTPPPPPPPMGGQAPAYGAPAQAPVSPSDARMWAMLAQIGGILFSVVAPLIVYVIYKDRDPFIRRHATQALNFQIIIAIVYFVSVPLSLIGIGVLTGLAAWICTLVFGIMAAMAANKGEEYTYPLVPQMVT
jgi:uncharacterized protein